MQRDRTSAEFLLEFFEVLGYRNTSDLKPRAHSYEAALTRIDGRMRAGDAPPFSAIVRIARLVNDPLAELLNRANERLRRRREFMHISRVREQDVNCIRWLTRQPGRTILEKIGERQRVKAVKRFLSRDVLENRVITRLADVLEPVAGAYLTRYADCAVCDSNLGDVKEKNNCEEILAVETLARNIREWRRVAREEGIAAQQTAIKPNNALLRDRRYRRIHIGLLEMDREQRRSEDAVDSTDILWRDVVLHVTAAALTEIELPLVDLGNVVRSDLSRSGRLSDGYDRQWAVLGLHAVKIFFVYPESDCSVAVVYREHRVDTVSDSVMRLAIRVPDGIATDAEAGPHSIAVESRVDGEVCATVTLRALVAPSWDGCETLRKLLVENLRLWLSERLPESQERMKAVEVDHSRRAIVRLRHDNCAIVTDERHTERPLAACRVNISYPESNGEWYDAVCISGQRGLHTMLMHNLRMPCEHDAQDNHHEIVDRLTGGQIRACLSGGHPALEELLTDYARSLVDDKPSLATLVWVIPDSLSFSERQVMVRVASNAAGMVQPLFVPQSVAVAFGCQATRKADIGTDKTYMVLDLVGEQLDLGVVKLCPSVDSHHEYEWRRYMPPFDWEPPSLSNLIQTAIEKCLLRSGVTYEDMAAIMSQASLQCTVDNIIDVYCGERENQVIWVNADRLQRVTINRQDVVAAIGPWAERLAGAVSESYSDLSEKGHHLIVNGRLSSIDELQRIIRGKCGNAIFLGRDLAIDGVRTLLLRSDAKLPTWRDELPKVELLVSSSSAGHEWEQLFRANRLPAFGECLVEKEPKTFVWPKGQTVVTLPLRMDGMRSPKDPCISLSMAKTAAFPVKVECEYRAGREGFVFYVSSKDDGILPRTEMSWGAPKVLVDDVQQPFVTESRLDINEFRRNVRNVGEAFRDHCNRLAHDRKGSLTNALRALIEQLRSQVLTSDVAAWMDAQEHAHDELIDIAAILQFLLLGKKGKLSSPAAGNTNSRQTVKLPHGSQAAQTVRHVSRELRTVCIRAVGMLRAAAPDDAVAWLRERAWRQSDSEIVHALSRSIGAPEQGTDRHEALRDIMALSLESLDDSAFRRWCWALGTILRSHRDAPFHLEPEQVFASIRTILRTLEDHLSNADSPNAELVKDALAALISFRHCTRTEEGLVKYGAHSTIAEEIAQTMERLSRIAKHAHGRADIANVEFRRLGVRIDKELTTAKSIFERVGQLWQGKVSVTLMQMEE